MNSRVFWVGSETHSDDADYPTTIQSHHLLTFLLHTIHESIANKIEPNQYIPFILLSSSHHAVHPNIMQFFSVPSLGDLLFLDLRDRVVSFPPSFPSRIVFNSLTSAFDLGLLDYRSRIRELRSAFLDSNVQTVSVNEDGSDNRDHLQHRQIYWYPHWFIIYSLPLIECVCAWSLIVVDALWSLMMLWESSMAIESERALLSRCTIWRSEDSRLVAIKAIFTKHIECWSNKKISKLIRCTMMLSPSDLIWCAFCVVHPLFFLFLLLFSVFWFPIYWDKWFDRFCGSANSDVHPLSDSIRFVCGSTYIYNRCR